MAVEELEIPSLENLMRTYGNDVLRTAYLYVKDVHLAEDIFQEVFLKVNLKMDSYRGESSIKTWLLRITINTCKDYLKSAWSKKVIATDEFETTSFEEQGYQQIENEEDNLIVRKIVMELPPKYKDVVLCVYYQEMSIEETAGTLNLAQGTVKSRLNRAKTKMKKVMEGRMSYGLS
ncbi:MAG TPA: sigma-70 family RNA polymerase sigma factor [Lachnospiraceae bacterium]|nr:sigma-70 family RNA polymerase sigma factor [Lachnospiraceae bacterium]